MKLPKHINLIIEHNPHTAYYQTVRQWLEDLDNCRRFRSEDAYEMLRADEIWTIQWYPDTPIGSYTVAAATLERALELANEVCT